MVKAGKAFQLEGSTNKDREAYLVRCPEGSALGRGLVGEAGELRSCRRALKGGKTLMGYVF